MQGAVNVRCKSSPKLAHSLNRLGCPCAGAIPERWQPGYVFSLAAAPGGGALLAACCSDGSLRTWAREGAALAPLAGVPPQPRSLVVPCAAAGLSLCPW